MSAAVELPAGVQHRLEAEAAVTTLTRHADRLHGRAMRARVGSNERRKALTLANHIRSCALSLANHQEWWEGLATRGVLTRGWRALAEAISDLHRKHTH